MKRTNISSFPKYRGRGPRKNTSVSFILRNDKEIALSRTMMRATMRFPFSSNGTVDSEDSHVNSQTPVPTPSPLRLLITTIQGHSEARTPLFFLKNPTTLSIRFLPSWLVPVTQDGDVGMTFLKSAHRFQRISSSSSSSSTANNSPRPMLEYTYCHNLLTILLKPASSRIQQLQPHIISLP